MEDRVTPPPDQVSQESSSDEEDNAITSIESSRHDVKVLVIGAANSGKTTLIEQYLTGTCPTPSTTLCLDVNKASVEVTLNNTHHDISYYIYDMAGMPKLQNHNASYYNNVFAVLFVFDVSCRLSLDFTLDWLGHYSEYCAQRDCFPPERILVCNKCDLQNKIMDRDKLFGLARDVGMTSVFETCALNGRNVDGIFSYIAQQYVAANIVPQMPSSTPPVASDPPG